MISVQMNMFPKLFTAEDKAKTQMLQALVENLQANIAVTQEDNTAWNNLHVEQQPKERFRMMFESLNVHLAFNLNKETGRKTKLQGGVSV